MGNSSDNKMIKNNDNLEKVMQNFHRVQEIEHPLLQKITIYDYKENPQYKIFKSSKLCTSGAEFNQLQKHYNNRKTWQHENIVKILQIKAQQNQQMCSESSVIVVMAEYYTQTLELQRQANYNNGQIFNESILWLMVYQIVSACSFLQQKGHYHGDIKPEYIFMDLEGSVKLIEYNMIYHGMNGFQKALTNNEFYFAAPELLDYIKNKQSKFQGDFIKADVFSLGITLLELASQIDAFQFYDWTHKSINYEHISQTIESLKMKGYSQILSNLIKEMLSDIENRPGFVELEEVLKHFEPQILSLSPFYSQPNLKQTIQMN